MKKPRRRARLASAARAALGYTAPVGLFGVLMMTALVRRVAARSSAATSSRPSRVSAKTGLAPASFTDSGKVTQYGLGMSTSSPGPQSAWSAS